MFRPAAIAPTNLNLFFQRWLAPTVRAVPTFGFSTDIFRADWSDSVHFFACVIESSSGVNLTVPVVLRREIRTACRAIGAVLPRGLVLFDSAMYRESFSLSSAH